MDIFLSFTIMLPSNNFLFKLSTLCVASADSEGKISKIGGESETISTAWLGS